MRLAISKGRILEEALQVLEKSGITCNEPPLLSRKLIFSTNVKDLEIIVVRASDVPIYIESGKVDIGIVGKDTLLEENKNNYFRLLDLNIALCKSFWWSTILKPGAKLPSSIMGPLVFITVLPASPPFMAS